jgi:hypothetical protein
MADTITHYVAERIIERERALEGDWLIRRAQRDDTSRREEQAVRRGEAREALAAAVATAERPRRTFDPRNVGWMVAAFLGGILLGGLALLAYAWVAVG